MNKRELPVFNTVVPESIYFEPRSKSERAERADAAQNRQRVLEAARRLFNQKGVEAVTMTEVAKEAGVGVGTVYRRYPDKGILCMALNDQATLDFQERVLSYLRGEGQTENALAQLNWLLEQMVEYVEENWVYLKPAQEAGRAFHKTSYYSLPVYQWQRSLVLLLLEQAVQQGGLEGDLDLDYLTDGLLAPLQPDLYYYHRQEKGYSTARISRGVKQLLRGASSAAPQNI